MIKKKIGIIILILISLVVILGCAPPELEVKTLFFENFEEEIQNWNLGEGWGLERIDNNLVLKGKDHEWAILENKNWYNYAFKSKFKLIQGTIHFNYRYDESNRYFIGVKSDSLYLNKQIEDKFYNLIAEAFLELDKDWHEIEIKGYENILNIYVDDALLIVHKDDDPILAGSIAFETLSHSEFLIDDIEIIETSPSDAVTELERVSKQVFANNIIYLDDLSLEDKIAQMIVTEGDDWVELKDLPHDMLGGIILGCGNKQECKGDTSKLQNKANIPLFIFTDLEGGELFTLAEFLSPGKIETAEESKQVGIKMGKVLSEVGCTTNFAPVADLGDDLLGWWKESRSFGTDPADVSEKVAAFVEGIQSEGIWATAKHFPGKTLIGSTETHAGLGYAEINEDDIEPFRAAADADVGFVMLSHVITTGVIDSQGKPSSVSKPTVDYLRTFFDGLIVTDDMIMDGVREYYSGNLDKMYIDTVKAGVDLILDKMWDSNQDVTIIIDAVKAAVLSGEIDESTIDESVERILEMKGYIVIRDIMDYFKILKNRIPIYPVILLVLIILIYTVYKLLFKKEKAKNIL